MARKKKPAKRKAPKRKQVKRPVSRLDRYVPDEEDVAQPERINPEDLKFLL